MDNLQKLIADAAKGNPYKGVQSSNSNSSVNTGFGKPQVLKHAANEFGKPSILTENADSNK